MANLLREMDLEGKTVHEKVKAYNDANRTVAILCNHKRTVTAAHGAQMEKMGDRIKGLKYQKWRLKQMMIDIDPKIKKKRGAEFFELDKEIDSDWIKEHQTFLVEAERQKIERKFTKENEKLKAEGEREMKAKELQERLQVADDLEKKFKKENKTRKVEAEGKGPSIEKLENNLAKIDQQIKRMGIQAEDKENNKEVALGTSKIVSLSIPARHWSLLTQLRTISTRVSQSSSPRNSTSRSRSSFPRLSVRNLTGRSNLLTKTGNSDEQFSVRSRKLTCIEGKFIHDRSRDLGMPYAYGNHRNGSFFNISLALHRG